MKTAIATAGAIYASSMTYPGAPQIMFAPENGSGSGGAGDADAIAAAAAAAAVEKHTQEVAAAEAAAAEAAAAQELQEAEDAAAAAAEAGKDPKTLADEKVKLLREVMDKKNKLKAAEQAARMPRPSSRHSRAWIRPSIASSSRRSRRPNSPLPRPRVISIA
ncbi:hypothetical protein U8P73_36500 (plasmid) [Rhizobium beringeri]|uniref:hypothetical protein n=1 Tax=Rhizobium beringeri TaxID=3019934 RepID=UPI002DDCE56E|nr:hypothetical protein [Rhizobium beringeri]WSG93474.1 hypothetical protein U8P73_36500 [Rhizobium beringeri]